MAVGILDPAGSKKNADNTGPSGVATKTPFGWRLCKQRLTVSVHTAGSRVDGKVFTAALVPDLSSGWGNAC